MAQLTRKEFSAGGVVFRRLSGAAQVLLIARKRRLNSRAEKAWCLPKGKIEKNEKPLDAAIREIKEETGISGRYAGLLGDIYYKFISPQDKAQVSKKVRFFLFEYESGSIAAQKEEIDGADWFEIGDALKIMSYPSEKNIMQQAKRELLR